MGGTSDGLVKFSFYASVSKGTYLRTLCTEIGKRLGYPALMSNLCRLKSGNFSIEQATSISALKEGNYQIVPMLEVLNDFHQIELDERLEKLVTNGMTVPVDLINSQAELVVFKKDNHLVGIYEKNNLIYKAVRIWK